MQSRLDAVKSCLFHISNKKILAEQKISLELRFYWRVVPHHLPNAGPCLDSRPIYHRLCSSAATDPESRKFYVLVNIVDEGVVSYEESNEFRFSVQHVGNDVHFLFYFLQNYFIVFSSTQDLLFMFLQIHISVASSRFFFSYCFMVRIPQP